MSRQLVKFLSISFLLLSFFWPRRVFLSPALAEDLEQSLGNLEQKRLEYENKIKELKSREKTLKNEINLMDSQITVTLLRINEVQAAIRIREQELALLTSDIGLIEGKIDSLRKVFEEQKNLFSFRAAASYKSNRISFWEIFLSNFNLAYLINRVKYLKVVELRDSRFLQQMEETRQVFQTQRIILDDKKNKVGEIKAQIEAEKQALEKYQTSLTRQKNEKQSLLSLTLNDENNYQHLLTQILAEIESVARSLKGGVKIGEVKKGDIIAREGNSGCVIPAPSGLNPTAGAHLHFGVYRDGVALNPRTFLDNGSLAWPESPTTVTQNFGDNYDFYQRNFNVPGHNALDMSTGYGSAIRAAESGVAYETGDSKQYAAWCNGKARGIRVEHPDGLVTIYWHVL